MEVDNSCVLIVGDPEWIWGKQLRPRPIQLSFKVIEVNVMRSEKYQKRALKILPFCIVFI
jgi:hypothetical protein